MRYVILWILISCWGTVLLGQEAVGPYVLDIKDSDDLTDVLLRLERQYQFRFSYAPNELTAVRPSPRELRVATRQELCKALFEGMPVAWRIQGDGRILIRYAPNELITLRGRLIDRKDGRPIDGASIYLLNESIATYSNRTGQFELQLPGQLWEARVVIQSLGYEPFYTTVQQLSQQAMVRMQAEIFSIPEVTISEVPLPPLEVPSFEGDTLEMDPGQFLGANAALGGSIQRLAQLEAGVSATLDLSNDLQIRGSEGSATLLILDDIPIYRADHFFGLFSNINPFYVSESTLYKNALPVEYGGRTGGMLLMQSPREVDESRALGAISFYDGGGTAAFPVGRRVDVQLAGRSAIGNAANTRFFDWFQAEADPTFIDVENLRRPVTVEPNPAFTYFDLNTKIKASLPGRYWLTASLFTSQDELDSRYDITYPGFFQRSRVENTESFAQQERWASLGSSLRLTKEWNNRWRTDWTAYYSDYQDTSLVRSSLTRVRGNNVRENSTQTSYQNQLSSAGFKVTTQWNRPQEKKPALLVGAEVNYHDLLTELSAEADEILRVALQATDYSAFGHYNWQPLDRLRFQLGSRVTFYSQTKRWYVSPRLELGYRLSNSTRLKTAYARQYQFLRSINYETIFGAEVDLLVLASPQFFPVASTQSYMLGAEWQRGPWRIDVEGYIKHQDEIVEYAQVRPGLRQSDTRPAVGDFLLFTGTGRIRGLDFTLGYQQNRFNTRLAYTLSKAEQRFPSIADNTYFPQPIDRPHQLKSINRLRLGNLEVSANAIYASGRTYTDITLFNFETDRRTIDLRQRTSRLPAYYRIDLGLQYDFQIGPSKLQLGLSVFNITDRSNVQQIQYFYSYFFDTATTDNQNTVIGAQTPLLGRTVNLSALIQL